nr:immunoglobulin light chain junction region [Macaca mulatta]
DYYCQVWDRNSQFDVF